MQLYILNPEYEVIGYIDETESTLWHKKFNGAGQCEIYIPCSKEMLEILKKGGYVFRYDDDMFCRIETTEITTDAEQGDYIISTANDIAVILAGRSIEKPVTHSGTLADYVYRLINENVINPTNKARKIDNFVFDTSNFDELTDTIKITSTSDDLLQNIVTACKPYNYGFRLSYDIEVGQFIFRLKKGKNKAKTGGTEYIEFSPNYANILSSNYKEDESNYKNVACVEYENSRGKPACVFAYIGTEEPQGEERRELTVSGSSVSRDITMTELWEMFPGASIDTVNHIFKLDGTIIATYTVDENGTEVTLTDAGLKPLLQEAGIQALTERVRTKEFIGNVDIVDTYEYKTDYELGDVVKVINEYGIEAEAIITEIMESEDNENGYTIEPKFEYQN